MKGLIFFSEQPEFYSEITNCHLKETGGRVRALGAKRADRNYLCNPGGKILRAKLKQ